MQIPVELLTSAGVGAIILLAAVHQYFKGRSPKVPDSAVLTGIGVGLIERDQAERAVRALERSADAIDRVAIAAERISDQRQVDMQHSLAELVEHLKGTRE